MKITTPIRTLVDLVSEGKIGAELIKTGARLKRGLINQKQIDKNPEIMEHYKNEKEYSSAQNFRTALLERIKSWPATTENHSTTSDDEMNAASSKK